MWVLRSVDGNTPRALRLASGSRTIGRSPHADFVVSAALVSRLHCRIVAANDELRVEDLESTNGTFVNDTRVQTAPLHEGDRLRLGRLSLTVSKE